MSVDQLRVIVAAIALAIVACAAEPAPPAPACEVVVITYPDLIVQVLAGAVCDGDDWVLHYSVNFRAGPDGLKVVDQRIDDPCGAVSDVAVLAGSFELLDIEASMRRGKERAGLTKCATRVEEQ